MGSLTMEGKAVSIVTEDRVALDARLVMASRRAPFVILAHGITVDREEEGGFRNLARALAEQGYSSLRFSFRGHGRSGLHSPAMTIAGEMLDLKAVTDYLRAKRATIAGVTAASFGAVATSLLSPYLAPHIRCLVMWNPVLDLAKTFVRPRTPWGRKNFAGVNIARVYKGKGGFKIDGEFEVGVVFWQEMQQLRPHAMLAKTKTPLLILHGDKDSYVPFATSRALAAVRAHTRLTAVTGADHGFPLQRDEKRVIEETVRFFQAHA